MNEDEVKVINKLKQTIDFNSSLYIDDLGDNDIKIILNLIDNQQKEIEEKNIAINKMSKDISRQLEEIEEKTTIIMAGAEKVKELEKGNRSLMESRIKWKNRYYKEKAKNKDKISELQTKLEIEKIDNKYNQEERDEETIPRYKIRDILNYLDNTDLNNYEIVMAFRKMMKELLEEDGDHIPRID